MWYRRGRLEAALLGWGGLRQGEAAWQQGGVVRATVGRQDAQHVREPGERVHAAALALAQHGVEDGGTLPGLRRADEEVVLAAYGDGAHGALHGVVVDGQARVCEPAFERVAALEGVVYRIPTPRSPFWAPASRTPS